MEQEFIDVANGIKKESLADDYRKEDHHKASVLRGKVSALLYF
jgi:hypothetical protein